MRCLAPIVALTLVAAGLSACAAPRSPRGLAQDAPRPAGGELPSLPPPPADAAARPPAPGNSENMLQNAGFEHNWFNRDFAKNRRFLLLAASDLGMGEEDGHVDYWRPDGIPFPDAWDLTVAHTGERSIRLARAGTVAQRLRFGGEQNWKTGGSQYAEFLPLDRALHQQIAVRPITVGAWCRTQEVPPGSEPEIRVRVECKARRGAEDTAVVDLGTRVFGGKFSGGTHDWEYREVRIDPAALPGYPMWVSVTLAAAGKGTVWFDDAACVEAGGGSLIPNGDFETVGADVWPANWGRLEAWTWWRSKYYLFTGWTHRQRPPRRGGAVLDPISVSGSRSLRLTVFPGDGLAVPSTPIVLNQDRPHPIEVRVRVRADRLRGLEVMAMDERGRWLGQPDFLGDDMEDNPDVYNMGTTGSGTYDWMTLRKYFSPREPVKSLRVFLCARGFDGVIVEKNEVGTVWFDGVTLQQHGAGEPAAWQPSRTGAVRLVDVRLGDRLWGRNRLEAWLALSGDASAFAQGWGFDLETTDPDGTLRKSQGRVDVVAPPQPGKAGWARAVADYQVTRLCGDWTEQYRVSATLKQPSIPPMTLAWAFGTPAAILRTSQSHYYAYPGETATVAVNLNVSRQSFSQVGALEFVQTRGPAVSVLRRVTDLDEALAPRRGARFADTTRLVAVPVPSPGAPHAWHKPVRDLRVHARLVAAAGKQLAVGEPVSLGYLQPPAAPVPLLPTRRTWLDERGYMHIDATPYFPVYFTPHLDQAPEATFPPRRFKLTTPDFNRFLTGKAPDAEVRRQVTARVKDISRDINLFGYVLGEGEMQLQGGNWEERARWLKTVAEWIRAEDPNHLIIGPESWLIGHPNHNETFAAFVPHFDMVGVEASFEEVPRIRQYARPLMKAKPTAILVGLETYFYQAPEVLRWRAYQAVIEGAAGVGLCPSGMLEARPERVNYLRGLNAEFRALGPIITAPAPKAPLAVSSPTVDVLERVQGGKRYLIAARSPQPGGAIRVRFAFPAGQRYSQVTPWFETGRRVAVTPTGFEDDFPTPRSVRVYELNP